MKKTVYYFKATFLALCIGGLASVALGQNDPFISVWQTSNNGTSANDEVMIPATGDYTYDWDQLDANGVSIASGSGVGAGIETIDFGGNGAGTYRISITPDNTNGTPFNRIEFNNSDDKDKIIKIEQWGDIVWSSLENAYYGADSLSISATDTLDLSGTNNMAFAFASTNLTSIPGMNGWNVSSVTDMGGLFYKAININENISDWDVSNVTIMDSMFTNAKKFNQDIGDWDVSQVTGMVGIFKNATKFNRSLENWDLQSVTDSLSLANSGLNCTNYSKTLHGWLFNPNLPSGIILNAAGCKHSVEIFMDKPVFDNLFNWTIIDGGKGTCLNILPDSYITVWKTDNAGTSQNDEVTIPATGDYDLYWAALDGSGDSTGVIGVLRSSGTTTIDFNGNGAGTYRIKMTPSGANPFNRINFANTDDKEKILNIEQWGKVSWNSLEEAYYGASNLTISATDIPNLSNVTSMKSAFSGTALTTVPVFNSWNLSAVTDMSSMFKDASGFNSKISNWNVSNVTDMSFMFENASSFNDTLSGWNMGSVINLESMFKNATSINGPLNNWNLSNVTNMNSMFNGATDFNQSLLDWNVGNVSDMENIFSNASSFNQPIGTWDLSSVVGTISLNNSGINCENYSQTLFGWSSNSTTPSNIILEANGLSYSSDLTAERDNLINNLGWTINGDSQGTCAGIISDPFITVWKTNNIGSSSSSQITIPARGQFIYRWEEVGNASNSGGGTGNSQTTITFPSIGSYQVSIYAVLSNSIDYIKFNNAGDKNKLTGIKQWGDIEWESMKTSYLGATNLVVTATDSPDLSNASSMEYAFGYTNITSIPNIGNWDVSNITSMKYLFYNAANFDQDISSWDISSVEDMSYMFAYASSFNQPIGSWDVSNVKEMSQIFDHASSFNQSLEDWKLRDLSGDISLAFSGMSCHNYSRSLRSWSDDTLTVKEFTLFAEGVEYGSEAKYYRQHLIDSLSWMIYGDKRGWCSLGVDEYDTESFTVYPNPTENTINIDGLQGNETVQLMDITGRILQTTKTNSYSLSLDLEHLTNGVYNLIIISKNGQIVNKKVIKQ